MAYIFRLYKSMKGNDLQNEYFVSKKSVFCPPNIGKTGGIFFHAASSVSKSNFKSVFPLLLFYVA